MSATISLDIPHSLGRDVARARIDRGVGKLAGIVPGGAEVAHHWDGDTIHCAVTALGQTITCRMTVFDASVHAEVDLPGMLQLFAGKVRDKMGELVPKLLK